jgi:hypothetical protein
LANSLYDHIDLLRQYDIYRKSNPIDHDVYVKGIPYVFITTPKLNLSEENVNRDDFLIYMKHVEPDLFKLLTTSGTTVSPFIKILSNAFRGIDGKDLASRTIDVGETFYGYKQTLPISIVDSQVGDTVTLHFEEYKTLPITKLHKLWVEYTEKVRRGTFEPSQDAIQKRYIDYVSSIYYFVLDFDGENILYWAKYTGAVPISVPYSELVTDGKNHEIPELSVEYVYSFKEDMNPAIFSDFNKVAMLNAEAMRYTTERAGDGFIPYTTNDLFPYNFTEEQISASEVLVIVTDPYESGGINPNRKYKLRFFK